MIDYPSALSTDSTPSLSSDNDGGEEKEEVPSRPVIDMQVYQLIQQHKRREQLRRHRKREEQRRKDARAKACASDAEKLARIVLSSTTKNGSIMLSNAPLTSKDILIAIQKFAELKQEITEMQRESQLSKKALVATQCSKMLISKRLARLEKRIKDYQLRSTELETRFAMGESPVAKSKTASIASLSLGSDDDFYAQDASHGRPNVSSDRPDVVTIETTATTSSDVPEEKVGVVSPNENDSMDEGLSRAGVESRLREWQSSFVHLNAEHERQVQACQTELERLHARIRKLEKTAKPEDIARAKAHLERLVDLVEAFPSKARLEGLRRQLEHSRRAEQATQVELAAALQELEEVKAREAKLLLQLQDKEQEKLRAEIPSAPVDSSAHSRSRSRSQTVSTRFLRSAKKKVKRVFRLDKQRQTTSVTKEETKGALLNSETSTDDMKASVPSRDGSLSSHSEEAKDEKDTTTADLRELSMDDDDDALQIFDASSEQSSVVGEDISLNASAGLANDDQGVPRTVSSLSFLQDKKSATAGATSDERSFATMTTSQSTAGTPLSSAGSFGFSFASNGAKNTRAKRNISSAMSSKASRKAAGKESKGFFSKAKNLLRLQ